MLKSIVSVWRRVRCEYSKLVKIAALRDAHGTSHKPVPTTPSRSAATPIVHVAPVMNPFSVNGRVFYKGCSVSHVAKTVEVPPGLHHVIHATDGTVARLRRIVRAPKGKSIVCFDYKQFECRVLAHMCKDVRLDNLLRQTDVDPFVTIANILFPPRTHSPPTGVVCTDKAQPINKRGAGQRTRADNTSQPVDSTRSGAATAHPSVAAGVFGDAAQRRDLAKTLMYGIMNGMGAAGVANKAGISVAQAQKVLTTVFRAFPKMRQYTTVVRTDAASNGYVKTICGRRRFLTRTPDLEPRDNARVWQREAVNGVIQGALVRLRPFDHEPFA